MHLLNALYLQVFGVSLFILALFFFKKIGQFFFKEGLDYFSLKASYLFRMQSNFPWPHMIFLKQEGPCGTGNYIREFITKSFLKISYVLISC